MLVLQLAHSTTASVAVDLFEKSGRTHTRQSISCPSTFDPQGPVCLANVSVPYVLKHATLY